MTSRDSLGPNGNAFKRLLEVCSRLTPEQVAALDRTNYRMHSKAAEDGDEYGEAEPESPHLRALDALHDSGRFPGATTAGLRPGPTWQPLLAVLVQDLISAEDYAEMTAPWLATFGKPVTDPT
jgi:hypothetical protein